MDLINSVSQDIWSCTGDTQGPKVAPSGTPDLSYDVWKKARPPQHGNVGSSNGLAVELVPAGDGVGGTSGHTNSSDRK